jgi:hypothetical protein
MRTAFSSEDLTALININGYGRAEEIVRHRGFWDDSVDPDYKPFIIHVTAEEWNDDEGEVFTDLTEGWAEVWAKSSEHAKTLAKKLTIKDYEWEMQDRHADPVDSLDDIDIENIEELERDDC